MEKKKSSFTREDIKPETAIKKEPGVTSSPKPVSTQEINPIQIIHLPLEN